MTHFPPSQLHEKRRKILRYIGIALSSLMVLIMLTVLTLIIRHESLYDERDCPFAKIYEKPFEGGMVVEEQRACVEPELERRYLITRPGKAPKPLAQRRYKSDVLVPQRYQWKVELDANQRVVLSIYVDGKLDSESHEEDTVKR